MYEVWIPDVITGLDVRADVNIHDHTVLWHTNRAARWSAEQRKQMDDCAFWFAVNVYADKETFAAAWQEG